MDVVSYLDTPPVLHQPVLVAAFRGWNDAGAVASTTVETLEKVLEATPLAEIDTEEFIDYQVNRPQARINDDGSRAVIWPSLTISRAYLPGSDRHVLFLLGDEPNLRWRAFTRVVVGLAEELGVVELVTLGALQSGVPHTRPVPVAGTASTRELQRRLGFAAPTYEGPTGIVGVLQHAAARAGLDALSWWAEVPHYLGSTTYLAGALALAERVVGRWEVDVSLDDLAKAAVAQRDEIAEVVAEDEDLRSYVDELEVYADDVEDEPPISGIEIAAEVERFLRDRNR